MQLNTFNYTLVENVMSKKAPTIARVTPVKGKKEFRDHTVKKTLREQT